MAKTKNLNLELTQDIDSEELFWDWQQAINGAGNEANKSNTQLVDEFAGKFEGGSANHYLKKISSNLFEMEWEAPDTQVLSESDNLITSGAVYAAIKISDNGSCFDLVGSGEVEQALSPDVFYAISGDMERLTLTLAEPITGRENEYKGQIDTGNTVPEITFPSNIFWFGERPSFEPNKIYQFSIMNNIGVMIDIQKGGQ